jgi:hypothetical protein
VQAHKLLFDEVGGGNGFYECWAMDALGEGRMEGPEWGLSGEERAAEVKSPECHAE